MTRVTTDVDAVNELFTSGVVTVFGDLFALVGIMVVMLSLDWRLALVTFAVIPFFFAAHQLVPQGRARLVPRDAAAAWRRSTPSCRRTSREWRSCSCSGASSGTARRSPSSTARHADANMQAIFYYAVFYPAIELLAALAIALILIRGGGLVLAGRPDDRRRSWPSSSTRSASGGRSRTSPRSSTCCRRRMAASERIFGLLDTPAARREPRRPQAAGAASRAACVRARVVLVRGTRGRAHGDRQQAASERAGSCGHRLRGGAGPQRRPGRARPAPARPRSSAC